MLSKKDLETFPNNIEGRANHATSIQDDVSIDSIVASGPRGRDFFDSIDPRQTSVSDQFRYSELYLVVRTSESSR